MTFQCVVYRGIHVRIATIFFLFIPRGLIWRNFPSSHVCFVGLLVLDDDDFRVSSFFTSWIIPSGQRRRIFLSGLEMATKTLCGLRFLSEPCMTINPNFCPFCGYIDCHLGWQWHNFSPRKAKLDCKVGREDSHGRTRKEKADIERSLEPGKIDFSNEAIVKKHL